MKFFLIIGGTGVMGTSAIRAIREYFDQSIVIIANWYGKEVPGFQIKNANHTLFGDINDPNLRKQLKYYNNGKYDYMFYATALGDVGIPIKDATREQINRSNKLSFDPIPQLEDELQIELGIIPVRLLPRRSSVVRSLRLPIPDGIVPVI